MTYANAHNESKCIYLKGSELGIIIHFMACEWIYGQIHPIVFCRSMNGSSATITAVQYGQSVDFSAVQSTHLCESGPDLWSHLQFSEV